MRSRQHICLWHKEEVFRPLEYTPNLNNNLCQDAMAVNHLKQLIMGH